MLETFSYHFHHGPGNETYRRGVFVGNCQAVGHAILRQKFEKEIPSWMRSEEIYFDETMHFRTVKASEPYIPSDVFLWGRQETINMKLLHWSIYLGIGDRGELLFEHANPGGIAIWPMERFLEDPRYAKLFAVKRVI